jgi:hypothetical protein
MINPSTVTAVHTLDLAHLGAARNYSHGTHGGDYETFEMLYTKTNMSGRGRLIPIHSRRLD